MAFLGSSDSAGGKRETPCRAVDAHTLHEPLAIVDKNLHSPILPIGEKHFYQYAFATSDIPRPTPIVLTPSPPAPSRYHRSWRETATETDGTRSRTLLDASRMGPPTVRDDGEAPSRHGG